MNNSSTTSAALTYWFHTGKQARILGIKRIQSYHLPCHQVCIDAWLDGWDRKDRELINSVAYQRALRTAERVEQRKARELANDVQAHVSRILFPNQYEVASKGE